ADAVREARLVLTACRRSDAEHSQPCLAVARSFSGDRDVEVHTNERAVAARSDDVARRAGVHLGIDTAASVLLLGVTDANQDLLPGRGEERLEVHVAAPCRTN